MAHTNLIRHILNNDFVSANQLFEEAMLEKQENKLLESKKMMQAEVFGGLSPEEIAQRKKMGYRKAADVLGDPDTAKKKGMSAAKKRLIAAEKKKKKVSEEALDEAGLAPTAVGKVYRAGRYAAGAVKHPKLAIQAAGSKVLRSISDRMSKTSEPLDQHADLRKTFDAERPEDKKRPGRLARNINTALGRKPGYVAEPKKPEDQGGRVGKVVNRVGKGLGAAFSSLGSQYGG